MELHEAGAAAARHAVEVQREQEALSGLTSVPAERRRAEFDRPCRGVAERRTATMHSFRTCKFALKSSL